MVKKIGWFLVLGLALVSCSRLKPLHKNKFVISGTFLEVTSPHSEAAAICHEEFKRLDKILNAYDPESEISRLNRSYNAPVKVSKDLIEILELSKTVHQLSQGAFDVSYGALYNFWKEIIARGGIENRRERSRPFPTQEEIDDIKELGGMNYIVIDSEKGTVTIKKEGLKIDLGAIAKGFMVDKAVLKLKEKGISSVLINFGGDLYCLGMNRGKFWKIGIKDPQNIQAVIESQILVDEAIATSGNYEQFLDYKGRRLSHLIDPRSGYPVESKVISISVITKNCTSADSLATAFLVLGLEGTRDFLNKNPSTMRIFVVTGDEKGKQVYFFN